MAAADAPPKPPVDPSVPACVRPSTPDEIFARLYSIFHRVAETSLGQLPGNPLPLAEASDRIRCDPDERTRKIRTRYAAIKLAAGIVFAQRHERLYAFVPAFQLALLHLGVSARLVELVAESHAITLPDLEDAGGTAIDTAPDGSPPSALTRKGCCPCIDQCQAGPSDKAAIVEYVISLNRPARCVFHVADPQCWPSVTPLNFAQTFLTASAPACTTANEPVCQAGSICNPTLPTPMPMSGPPQPATPWCGLLYEDFKAQYGTMASKMTNVLGVRTAYDAPGIPLAAAKKFRMDFKLCRSIDYDF